MDMGRDGMMGWDDGMVWYGVVWYGMVWYGMVWDGMMGCVMGWARTSPRGKGSRSYAWRRSPGHRSRIDDVATRDDARASVMI
jgi:hypothetical protein